MSNTITVATLDQTRMFAELLAAQLRAGDVLLLTGNLGAGKTTLTQAIGQALGVAGRIASPTFIIAREHRATGSGPGLVHVDAYRLEDAVEFSDLDLDSELDEVVTIVEWGRGKAESLSETFLDIAIDRTDPNPESEARSYTLIPHGSGWDGRIATLVSACQEAL